MLHVSDGNGSPARIPPSDQLRTEQAMLSHDAFFGATEMVDAAMLPAA
jgi:hypothetical protein